ncbi:MAG: hypothetical protein K6E10_08925 [Eubacterium sp.]|nr:hypothetical protein [Eubacterium sp.]
MKNQYVADVGDFGKYALLKYLEDSGIKLGINWYLIEDDDTNDGQIVAYLEN